MPGSSTSPLLASDEGSFPPALRALGLRVLDDLPAMTDRLVAMILAGKPSYRGSLVARADLSRSCRDNLHRLVQTLAGTITDGEDPYDAPRATGRRRARQGMALEDVLGSYRLGGKVIWEAVAAEAQHDPDISADALVETATWVWEVVDRFSSQVADAYREFQAERAREDYERQRLLLEALLEGRGSDAVLRHEAATALGLPETGTFRVLVTPVPAAVEGQSRLPLPDVGGLRTVTLSQARHRVSVLDLGTRPDDADATLRAVLAGPAGLSSRVAGLAELGAARRLAETALRTVTIGMQDVAWVDERLPEALVVRSPDLAARLVATTLGPLLALDPAERDLLLSTLESLLQHGGSTTRTAKALYCHRNTVLNRLRRLESLLGRRLDETPYLVDLSLALRAHRLLAAAP